MRIYWTKNSFPELAGLTRKERRVAWQTSYWQVCKSWRFWVKYWVVVAPPVLLGCAIGDAMVPDPVFVDGEFTRPSILPFYIGVGSGGAIGGFVASQILYCAIHPHLRSYLQSADSFDRESPSAFKETGTMNEQ